MITIFDPGFVQLVGATCVAAAAVGVAEAQGGVPLVVTPEWLAGMQDQLNRDPGSNLPPLAAAESEDGSGEVEPDDATDPDPDSEPKSSSGDGPPATPEDSQPIEAVSTAADG